MIPVDQTVFEDGKGDCLRACVASVTGIPYSDIPNFAEDGSYTFGMIAFLIKRGYVVLRADFTGDGYDGHTYYQCLEAPAIICGKSPRSTPEKRKGHAVVGRATGWGFEIEHDPHPSREGITGNPESVLWIFRPAQLTEQG